METVDVQVRNAGWHPGRRVALNEAREKIESAGFRAWNALVEFFEEYSGLHIRSLDNREVWIDVAKAIACADVDWVEAYEERLARSLAPIGGYSHMMLYMAEDGSVYGGYDYEFGRLGANIRDAVDNLLNYAPEPLDMRLDR